jgi:septal ring factor EnvC (AmiA/AmiB activator)
MGFLHAIAALTSHQLWAAVVLTGSLTQAAAQAPLRISPPTPQDPTKFQHEKKELERLRQEQRKVHENEVRLASEVEAIGQDRRKLSQALIDTAARLRAVEARIAAGEERIKALDESDRALGKALEKRRAVIGELLAALQRIGRKPPPALMVRPEDALQSVRTAIMLGAVLPEMRAEADGLAAELADLVRVRSAISEERENLAREMALLSEERTRVTLLSDERQKRQSEAEKALEGERRRAALLAKQADTLKDLVAKLDLPAASRPGEAEGDRKLGGQARLSPAIAFGSAKRALPLPVNGAKIRSFGAPDGVGGTEKGLTLVTRSGAQVTAPCDGQVVYAGPFRSYGQLLILNAGGGYHVLLAGMERISVDLGQFVLTGEPVAMMGSGPQIATSVAIGANQPLLYVEFRKDSVPVDPSPWWTSPESEKVRG